jgi:2-polyprenyl-3-methyl-5-hydroxy-6-metoxy-1,4-benzoquinol methylase
MADEQQEAKGRMKESQQGTNRFDEAAATWDDNPRRRQLSEAIAQAIQQAIPLQKAWRVPEYGCGTATLGFLLAPHVREVVATDASAGMIEQVRRKLAQSSPVNLTPMLLDLSQQPAPTERFDLIVTAMAMHHVEDVQQVLARLGEMLTDGGCLAIADLCQEDGSFHEDIAVPHNGFAPDVLSGTVATCIPLTDCHWHIVHTVAKNNRQFDVFLLTAHRGLS